MSLGLLFLALGVADGVLVAEGVDNSFCAFRVKRGDPEESTFKEI